ncbi:MAG: single-stranded-DNA-specific exonuclease RecJ [Alphaproteobacteria bacterium]
MDAPFLGVERSLLGKIWRTRGGDERAALTLSQRLDLPEIVGRILAARGVGVDEAPAFLAPTLRQALPDPSHLLDLDKAVARLVAALKAREPVAVFGDYDVDGATSAALLARYFAAVGATLVTYIPDRQKEGYGPNEAALRKLAADGIRVVVTVDCGISAHEALAAGSRAGLDVIVVDHHAAEPKLPDAWAIVNPNRLDETSPHKNLAAVGVTFLLLIGLNRALRAEGRFRDRAEPDLLNWLDLVALGTICDVVPLTGLNRALVTQGLKIMARRDNPGLAALADVAAVRSKPGAYHAGFIFGPRVNAGGRIGESDLGVRLLLAEDAAAAAPLAQRLDKLNKERQAIEASVLTEALIEAERRRDNANALVLVAKDGWHPGVVGIVAARLVERFNRPSCVIAIKDGVGKGSGRSIQGLDLGAAIIAARQAGLLINGGGHKMAAGLTVAVDKIEQLRAFLSERLQRAADDPMLRPSLGVDGAISVEAATPDFCELIERIGPFGAGNAEPRFALPAVRIAKADVVGTQHVRCFLAGEGGGRLKAIAFRAVESPLGQALLNAKGGVLHLAGHLRPDDYQGRSDVQFFIDDAAPAH